MIDKPTLVIGASLNPDRYSNRAINLLSRHNIRVYALGLRNGRIGNIQIETQPVIYRDIHTISLYVNPKRQSQYYEYILSLSPERVIFNPGTENSELEKILEAAGIYYVEHCTLVMLRSGIY